MIVLFSVTPPPLSSPAPTFVSLDDVARFPAIVALVQTSVPWLNIPPAAPLEVLLATVLLINLRLPPERLPKPAPKVAELFETVHPTTLSSPLFSMPP